MATNTSDISAATGNPNVRKFLDMLAQSEGVKYGYATGFGNRPLSSLEDHPRTQSKFTQTDGKENSTSAAGRYQFLQKTWDDLKKQYGDSMPDFGADSQDFAATALLAKNGALPDVLKGDFKSAVNKAGSTWASLPSSPYKQTKRSWSDISSYLGEEVSGGGGGAPVANESPKQNISANLGAFKAYQSGQMSDPQQRADFENDVHSGVLQLPKTAIVKVRKPAQEVPIAAVQAFNEGKMNAQQSADFLRDVDAGKILIPKGANLQRKAAQEAQPTTLLGDIGQGISKLGSSIVGDGGAIDLITGLPKAVYGAVEAVGGGLAGMGQMAAKGIYGGASGLSNMLPQAIGGGGAGFGAGFTQGAQAVENLLPLPPMATNAGQAIQQIMGAPSAEFARGGAATGQLVEDITGSQVLGGVTASGVETLGNALQIIAPLKARIAPEIAAAERTRQQIVANPPIERAAPITPAAAEVAPTAQPVRTTAEKLDADIAAYQAERAAQQPLAASPEGLAAQAETMQSPAVEVGKPAIHNANGVETPVVVKNIEQQAGSDGKIYARVESDGKDSIVPADELVAVADEAKPITPSEPVTPISAIEPMTQADTVGLPLQELASKARTSTEGIIGKKSAQEVLVEQAAPSAPVVAAAKRLGIIDSLQPDHVTTNQSFRELSQAIKSYTGSPLRSAELEGLQQVATRADKIISDIGADKDVSSLSQKIKTEMQATVDELSARANPMYEALKAKIPANTQVRAPSVLAFIEERISNLGGKEYLSPLEKTIHSRLSDKTSPTYARLDDIRRELTAARYKKEGVFKDADSGLIKKLETELKKDQQSALSEIAPKIGMTPEALLSDFKLANDTVSMRKSIEEHMVNLFGKQLDGNISRALKNAVNGLPMGDTKAFASIIKSIPESMRSEAVANGLAYAFDKNLGAINHNTFANFWNGIKRQGEANKLLKQYLPEESYKALDDLGIVSESISKASKERIVTGRLNVVNETLKEADTMIGKLYEKAKAGAGAALGAEAISATAGAPGVGIAIGSVMALLKDKPPIHLAIDNLLGSKEFRDMIATKSKMEALRGQK